MCSAGEHFDWAMIAINCALFVFNTRSLWCLHKKRNEIESAIRHTEASRAQASKLRDEWKIAKMLSDASKDRT
jgi:hypothetical protein